MSVLELPPWLQKGSLDPQPHKSQGGGEEGGEGGGTPKGSWGQTHIRGLSTEISFVDVVDVDPCRGQTDSRDRWV